MKKIVFVVSLVASFVGFSSFGQGYFQFTTGKSQVWDGFSTGVAHVDSNINVAFLWGLSGAAPQVESILNGVPTTATAATSTYTPQAAWTAILNDPNFTLAVNDSTSALAVTRTSSNGAITYNGGSAFPVTGTTIGTYTLFMIGWDGSYATPAQAAANAAAVGWSQAFQYTSFVATASPNSMSGVTPEFGVVGMVDTIPEPASMTLAGLGGLSLLLLRRRK